VARDRSTYRCQACGFAAPKAGTCPDCARLGNFVALVEERAAPSRAERPRLAAGARPMLIGDIAVTAGERVTTGIGELDRVLGGGLVPIGASLGVHSNICRQRQHRRVGTESTTAADDEPSERSLADMEHPVRSARRGVGPSQDQRSRRTGRPTKDW
jgi:hypothetical protein